MLRAGLFFSTLFERRRRVDPAWFAVVMEAYVNGVAIQEQGNLENLGVYR